MGIRIALAGNPNSGKTTMFNGLTGSTQYVGNWPGVTVEKKEGRYTNDKDVLFVDLPGVYSLSPYSPEEIVTRDYLMSGEPDAVIDIVDATNLERNLYLATQIAELGIPIVVALNMTDLIEKNGDKIDFDKLSKQLGCPVIATSALRKTGLEELVDAAKRVVKEKKHAEPGYKFDARTEEWLAEIDAIISDKVPSHLRRWYSVKLFEGEEKSFDDLNLSEAEIASIEEVRNTAETVEDDDAESIITGERYDAISHIVDDSVKRSTKGMNLTQKIDRVVTNRILGLPIFIAIMTFVYFIAVSTVGTIATDWANDGLFGDGWLYSGGAEYEQALEDWEGYQDQIDVYLLAAEKEGLDTSAIEEALGAEELSADNEEAIASFIKEADSLGVTGSLDREDGLETITGTEFKQALEMSEPEPSDFGLWIDGIPVYLGSWLESIGTAAWLQSLIIDGAIAGVGAVLGFVPQMIVLFLLLTFLEGCGYMARVAFIMDHIFRKFGLSGKSFIPMLISSGCGVPGVMATKTIENEKDRRMTIMTTTMIPCGAKLPIIALVFGAIAGGDAASTWWVAPMFYFLGVFAIIVSGIMLKKTKMFAGRATPFIMELPNYRLPALKNVLLGTWERVKSFIVKAGTIIFISAIIIWFLLNFGFYQGSFGLLDPDMQGYIDYSLMAVLGKALAWLFVPLGFGSWDAAVATITGLVAKENVVATLGILFALGEDVAETDLSLWASFGTMFGNSTPAIMAFCAFNLLCAPCFAAIGAIRRQMESAKWTWFAIGYMTIFAWVISLIIYQFAGLIMGELQFNVWTVIAIVLLAAMLFQLFRPMPKYDLDEEDAHDK